MVYLDFDDAMILINHSGQSVVCNLSVGTEILFGYGTKRQADRYFRMKRAICWPIRRIQQIKCPIFSMVEAKSRLIRESI